MQTKLTELLTLYRHKIPQIFGTVILSLFLLFPVHLKAQDDQSQNYDPSIVKNGENLFKGNCTVCHAIDEVIIGPALRDVHERQSEEWIYAFIKNSQKVSIYPIDLVLIYIIVINLSANKVNDNKTINNDKKIHIFNVSGFNHWKLKCRNKNLQNGVCACK